MTASNSFEVLDLHHVPGRSERLAVLRVLSGSVSKVSRELYSPQLPGRWRVTSTVLALPQDEDMARAKTIAVGLQGSEGLCSGAQLFEVEEGP